MVLSRDQLFHLQVFCNLQEGVEVSLFNIDLSLVDECQHSLHIRSLDALQIDQWMAVRILLQDPLKKGELAAKITWAST